MYRPFFGSASNLIPPTVLPRRKNLFDPTIPEDNPDVGSSITNLFSKSTPSDDGTDDTANFVKQYQDITGNTPARLAYQSSVNQGPQQIQRGKWAKLGALLAGAGGALGGSSVPEAINTATSQYYAPQERANENWARQNQGLARLATMEQSDIDNRIKGLEFQYNTAKDRRDFAEKQKMDDATIANQNRDNDRQDWTPYTDFETGNTYQYNTRTGERKLVGKTKDSDAEKKQDEIDKYNREQAGRVQITGMQQTGEDKRTDKQTAAQIKAAEIAAGSRENVAKTNADARIGAVRAKLQTAINGMKPSDQARQALVDLDQAYASDPVLQSVDPTDYVDKDPTTGLPVVKGPSMFDSDNTKAIKSRIKAIIDQSIARSKGGNKPAGTPDPLGIR